MPKPSPSLLVSSLALLVAVSGTAYAAGLPRNSVGTPQLKNGAVTSAKVKDGSLGRKDFQAGVLTQGPQGPQGPAGADGADGADGVVSGAGAHTSRTPAFAIPSTDTLMFSLSEFADVTSGVLEVPSAGTLLLQGAVVLESAVADSLARCRLQVELTPDMWVDAGPEAKSLSLDETAVEVTMSLSGVLPITSGTYDIRMLCRSTDMLFRSGTFTAVVTS